MTGGGNVKGVELSKSEPMATVWPRRVRVPGDPNFAMAGCTEYARGLGRKDGFYLASEKVAADGTRESFSQRREREWARAWRLRLGPEQWQELTDAYADEIRQNLEDENRIHDRKKETIG
jgi:hypothetical protein